jgi:hypothetical protein
LAGKIIMDAIRLCLAAIGAALLLVPTSARAQAVQDLPISSFTDVLSSYGGWIDVPVFGHVWQPDAGIVGSDFRPYGSNGHWAYTSAGWTFVSGYDWGWATFHYGRWVWLSNYRWVWVPGSVWAPAWVDWRYSGTYVGWFPMAAPGYVTGPYDYERGWTIVSAQHLTSTSLMSHAVEARRVSEIHATMTPVTVKGAFSAGPPRATIAHAMGQKIPVTTLEKVGALPRPVPAAKPGTVSPGAENHASRVITIAANPAFDKPQSHSGSQPSPGSSVHPGSSGGSLTIPPSHPQEQQPAHWGSRVAAASSSSRSSGTSGTTWGGAAGSHSSSSSNSRSHGGGGTVDSTYYPGRHSGGVIHSGGRHR